jgi:hypothetical protein
LEVGSIPVSNPEPLDPAEFTPITSPWPIRIP